MKKMIKILMKMRTLKMKSYSCFLISFLFFHRLD